ncbi:MAG: LLM class flavin-dependent oxidoreductase [Chloroflexi bacterium]|nr:LLM class flavin-dependent oxidoreductase [Chloroflexota bacterium]
MKVGLVMPIAFDEGLGAPRPYAEIRDLARAAEAAGFDSIWVFDHLLYRFDGETKGIWEAWSTLCGLAEATERVELGTLVLCTAFRNPALQAKMAVTIDEISEGRLILGLGCGWHEPEFEAFGFPFDHRVDRFEEALQIIMPLLRDGAVDFQGHYQRATNGALVPRGPRPSGIPVLIAAKGPRMLRLAAEHADAWNTAWFGNPSELVASRRADLAAAMSEVGRAPGSVLETVGMRVAFPDVVGAAPPDGESDPQRVLIGSTTEIAAALVAYDGLGIDHLICWLEPATPETVQRMAEALRAYRD